MTTQPESASSLPREPRAVWCVVVVVLAALCSHGWLLLNHGIFWDSWLEWTSHGVGDLVATRRGGRVVEVVQAHAMKKDFTFVNSRTPATPSSRP